MAQCIGRSERTGERCRRSAAAGATTCYYHGPAAATKVKPSRSRVDSGTNAATSRRPTFTTKELSKRMRRDQRAAPTPPDARRLVARDDRDRHRRQRRWVVAQLAEVVGRRCELCYLRPGRGDGRVLAAHGRRGRLRQPAGHAAHPNAEQASPRQQRQHARGDGELPVRGGREEEVAALVGLVDEDEPDDELRQPRRDAADDRSTPAVADEHEPLVTDRLQRVQEVDMVVDEARQRPRLRVGGAAAERGAVVRDRAGDCRDRGHHCRPRAPRRAHPRLEHNGRVAGAAIST